MAKKKGRGGLVRALGSQDKFIKQSIDTLNETIDALNDNISGLGDAVRGISERAAGDAGIGDTGGLKESIDKLTATIEKGGKDSTTGGRRGSDDKGKTYSKRRANYNWERMKRGDLGKDPLATAGNAVIEKGLSMLGPVGSVVKGLIDIAEFAISKVTEYMTLNYENQMRAMQAIVATTTNTMQANLSLWQDSLSGAYEAQNLAMSSHLAMIEAQNANTLAAMKLTHTWSNWVPVWGTINKYQEEELRLENEIKQQRLKNAQEIIQKGEGYAKQIDEYLKKQDQAVHDYTRSVGLSVGQTAVFEQRMMGLGTSLAKMNRTIEDAVRIQQKVQEQSGRVINYSNSDYENTVALGKVLGDDTVARFQAEMVIFNQSIEGSTAIMEDMYHYANTMGLSQKKLTQNILSNIKTANKYQFKGGLRGFIEFSKWAENVRFNVAQLGNMIEKIQTGGLEGVIKQAAQLQVLGGNFAMHADPLRMAFNAFQDPEELAKNFYDSLKAEGVFDTKTGELYRGVGNQIRVRQAAEAYGYSYEDTVNMLRERTKKEDIDRQLKNSGLSEAQRQAVANGAQRDENGNWYVNTIGGQRVNVSEIGQNFNMESILSTDQNEKMAQYAKETLSAAEKISANTQYISALIGASSLDMFNRTVDENSRITKEGFEKYKSSVVDAIAQVYNESTEAARAQVEGLATLSTDMKDAYAIQRQANEDVSHIKELLDAEYGKLLERQQGKEAYAEAKKVTAEKEEAYNKAEKKYGLNSREAKKAEEELNVARLVQKKEHIDAAAYGTGWWRKMGYWLYKRPFDKEQEREVEAHRIDRSTLPTQLPQTDDVMLNSGNSVIIPSTKITPINDGITSNSGSSVVIPSSKVTPINDGAAEFAKTNPNDSAIFAKTGGPFDKLFDDIFGRIDAVYNAVMPREKSISDLERDLQGQNIRNYNSVYNNSAEKGIGAQMRRHYIQRSIRNYASSVFNNPIANSVRNMVARPVGSDMAGTVREYSGATGGGIAQTNNNTSIDFKPIRLEINGRLDIAGGGANMNIMQELKKDPFFIRSLTQLISNSLSEKVNGGKALYNGGNLTYL